MLSAEQIAEWEAFDTLEPIDTNVRMEYMIANAIATIVDLLCTPKKGEKPITALNFVPDWEKYARKKVFPVKRSKVQAENEDDVANKILQFFTMIGKEEGNNG